MESAGMNAKLDNEIISITNRSMSFSYKE